MKTIIVALVLLVGCGDDLSPGPTHVVTWSTTGRSDSRGEPEPIECTMLISHPCPILMYMQLLDITPGFGSSTSSGSVNLRWWDGAGGADFNGRKAEDELPVIEAATTVGETLVLHDRGDDAGLRHETTLTKNEDGFFEGDVSWSLFTVAGHTSWHISIQ